jgi:CRISPR/Cas system endoribonuclease Cas6 (RAMP superfamily)
VSPVVIREYLVKRGGDKINNKLVMIATFLLKNLLQKKYNEINAAKDNDKATSFTEIRFCPNNLKNGTINSPTTSEPPS